MNYGRTTNTTTHRDTPLSRTPEPMLFKDLPEVTVRANAKPLSLKTGTPASAGKHLTQQHRMYKSTHINQLPKKAVKEKKKLLTADNALLGGVLGFTAGVAGAIIDGEIKNRKWKKYQRENSSPYTDNIVSINILKVISIFAS
jgi:hypothetical protein